MKYQYWNILDNLCYENTHNIKYTVVHSLSKLDLGIFKIYKKKCQKSCSSWLGQVQNKETRQNTKVPLNTTHHNHYLPTAVTNTFYIYLSLVQVQQFVDC